MTFDIWLCFQKRKKLIARDSEDSSECSSFDATKQTRLHYEHTQASRWKKKALENVYDLFSDLESDPEENAKAAKSDEEQGRGAAEQATTDSAAQGDDPTFELANVRRFIVGKEPVSKVVANSRKMFLLKVNWPFLFNHEKSHFSIRTFES